MLKNYRIWHHNTGTVPVPYMYCTLLEATVFISDWFKRFLWTFKRFKVLNWPFKRVNGLLNVFLVTRMEVASIGVQRVVDEQANEEAGEVGICICQVFEVAI